MKGKDRKKYFNERKSEKDNPDIREIFSGPKVCVI